MTAIGVGVVELPLRLCGDKTLQPDCSERLSLRVGAASIGPGIGGGRVVTVVGATLPSGPTTTANGGIDGILT